jgi:hypothetical protein
MKGSRPLLTLVWISPSQEFIHVSFKIKGVSVIPGFTLQRGFMLAIHASLIALLAVPGVCPVATFALVQLETKFQSLEIVFVKEYTIPAAEPGK